MWFGHRSGSLLIRGRQLPALEQLVHTPLGMLHCHVSNRATASPIGQVIKSVPHNDLVKDTLTLVLGIS
jgi:hypothetical protein